MHTGSLLSVVILIIPSHSLFGLCSNSSSSHLLCDSNIDSHHIVLLTLFLVIDHTDLLDSSSGENSLLQTRNQTYSSLDISFPRPYYLLRHATHMTTELTSTRQRKRKKDPAKISFPFLHLLWFTLLRICGKPLLNC